MKHTIFKVGKPFPGPVPHREGANMELWETGLVVLIQMPGLRPGELKTFKDGFKKYSYLESDTTIPIAVWIFDFPNPHGAIDCNFNARIVKRAYIDGYLDETDGIKNLIHFFLLDRQMLKAQKIVGIHPEAIELFQETIRKQLAIDYSQVDFDGCLAGLFTHTTEELFKMGEVFDFGQ